VPDGIRALLSSSALGASERQHAQLVAYAALLTAANDRLRLVSKGDLARLADRHLGEAVGLAELVQATLSGAAVRIADLGSGGGLPGVPLAVLLQEARLVLVERSSRKATFLRQVLLELKLANAEVVCADARAAAIEPVAIVVSRAAADTATLWPMARRMLLPGGRLYAMDRVATVADAGAVPVATVHDPEERFEGGEIDVTTWLEIPATDTRPGHRHRVRCIRKYA
jgi:16S rRNA (guanine527-N7)-methyltransferase